MEMHLGYRGTVYPWQCDHMGHLNVMWYVGKFDEASWQCFAALGLTRDWLQQAGRGMAAVEQQLSYRRELRAGDVVSVHTELLEVRDRSMRLRHVMRDDGAGEVAASTTLVAVHLDIMARRAAALPADVRARAATWIASPR